MSPHQRAIQLAFAAHQGQMYGSHPYTYHLEQVVTNVKKWQYCIELQEYGNSYDCLVAAWLHDVVEDTSVTIEEVTEEFGKDVGDIVDRVTNIEYFDGRKLRNRREKHAKSYPRIAESHSAIFVKLCDRIANVQACDNPQDNKNLCEMYRKEHESFEAFLKPHSPDSFAPMWSALDKALDRVCKI